MNPKIKKINAEYDKNAAKIAELQARQKELVRQRTELENSDILELVHSHDLDITRLAALIRTMNTDPAAALRGETTLAEGVARMQQASRNYAKRQITWLKRDGRTQWIPAMGRSAEEIAQDIYERIERK